jgi:O-antigen ligase
VSYAPTQINIGSPGALRLPARPLERVPHPVATKVLLFYLFLMMSRGVELLSIVMGVNVRLTMILMLFSLVAALLTGRLLEAVKTPVVVMFTGLTCWLLFCTLTSQWRGGSVGTLTNFWISSFACALLVPSLISSLDQCRRLGYVLAYCLLPILLTTVLFQSQVQGRDSTLYGTLGNPNDLAFSLLLLIPFAVFVIQSESWRSWKTIVCASAIIFSLLKVLKTGSRAGVFSIVACLVIVFFSGPLKTKVKVLVMTALIVAISVAFVPATTLLRYATVFSGTSYEEGMSADQYSAVESTRARKMLLQESIHIMLEHPLFGVGPGIFSASLAAEQKERGEYQTWHEAHNSFTQLGSEAGIPALLLYVGVVVYCLKRTISIYRRTRHDPNRILICRLAGSLAMSLVVFAICASFGNYSYTFHLPIVAGLVQAFDVCVRRDMMSAPAIVPVLSQVRPITPTQNSKVPNYVRNRRLRDRRV